jgi:hypothetical protein
MRRLEAHENESRAEHRRQRRNPSLSHRVGPTALLPPESMRLGATCCAEEAGRPEASVVIIHSP